MVAAAVALRRAGAGWLVTVLLGLTALFAIHPPPVGPAALVCFAVAAVLIERWLGTGPARQVSRRRCRTRPHNRLLRGAAMKTPVIQNEPDEPRARTRPGSRRRGDRPTWPAGWAGGARSIGRPPSSVGSRSWSSRSRLGIVSGTTRSTRTPPAWASRVASTGSSTRASRQPAGESVLVQSEHALASDPAFAGGRRGRRARVSSSTRSRTSSSPLDPENAGQIGQSGHAALVDFEIRGDPDDATTKIDPVVAAVADVQQAHPEFFIGEFGDASVDKEIEAAFLDDLKKAGLLSIPVTLIILIVVFGALVAAGIPLLLALTAIIATFGLVALPSSLVPIDEDGLRADPPDRARGRRRLLDVLLEAGAGGTGRGAQRGGSARGGRSHVRPLGAHLRADRHRRHVRHVPRRDPGHVGVRRGHDPRGRGRDARLAHRPAGHPLWLGDGSSGGASPS